MAKISGLDTGASLFLDHRSVEATERIGGYKLPA